MLLRQTILKAKIPYAEWNLRQFYYWKMSHDEKSNTFLKPCWWNLFRVNFIQMDFFVTKSVVCNKPCSFYFDTYINELIMISKHSKDETLVKCTLYFFFNFIRHMMNIFPDQVEKSYAKWEFVNHFTAITCACNYIYNRYFNVFLNRTKVKLTNIQHVF